MIFHFHFLIFINFCFRQKTEDSGYNSHSHSPQIEKNEDFIPRYINCNNMSKDLFHIDEGWVKLLVSSYYNTILVKSTFLQ